MNKPSELIGQLVTTLQQYVPQEDAETCILGGYIRIRNVLKGGPPCLEQDTLSSCDECIFATQNIECVRELSNQLKMLEVLDD